MHIWVLKYAACMAKSAFEMGDLPNLQSASIILPYRALPFEDLHKWGWILIRRDASLTIACITPHSSRPHHSALHCHHQSMQYVRSVCLRHCLDTCLKTLSLVRNYTLFWFISKHSPLCSQPAPIASIERVAMSLVAGVQETTLPMWFLARLPWCNAAVYSAATRSTGLNTTNTHDRAMTNTQS